VCKFITLYQRHNFALFREHIIIIKSKIESGEKGCIGADSNM